MSHSPTGSSSQTSFASGLTDRQWDQAAEAWVSEATESNDSGRDLFVLAQHEAEVSHGDEEAFQAVAGDDHGAEHAAESVSYRGGSMPEEFPNISTLIMALGKSDDHGEGGHHAPFWLNPAFAAFHGLIFIFFVHRILRRRSVDRPSRAQVAVEALFLGVYDFFGEIIGKAHARKFAPFVATLWLFILINKLSGLVPGLKSPWAHFPSVFALGICSFVFVNYNAIRIGGAKHFFWHLCGSPTDMVGWAVAPLMLLLETIGTFIKPVSLSLRLYGNTFGEDKLLATFLGFGMILSAMLFGTATPPGVIPLHLPFMFLAILMGVIQATVFAMLTAVYIAMLLPHEHHDPEDVVDASHDFTDSEGAHAHASAH